MKKIILLLFFPILLFGQDNNESNKALAEIDAYIKQIDSIYKNSTERIIEGTIEYKKLKRKNGGWEAYYIDDVQTKGSPLRIRYAAAEFDTNTKLDLYYKNRKLIYADLTVIYTTGKKSPRTNYTRKFYFPDTKLYWQTRTTNKEFDKADKTYNYDYLFKKESEILKMIYK